MSAAEWQFLAADAARVGFTGALPAHRRITLATEPLRVSALTFGAGHPEYVLLHGAGLNAHSFDALALLLGAPTLAVDLPGHGKSAWRPDADYSAAVLAQQLLPALTQTLSRPVTLVGHSLGGLAAAHLAQAAPRLIAHLILIDITPDALGKQASQRVSEFITGKRSFTSREQMVERAIDFGIGSDRQALRRGVTLNSRQRPDGRFEWTHHFAHLPALTGARADAPQLIAASWQALQDLSRARVPISLIRASAGMVTAKQQHSWKRALPAASAVTVNGPHNLHEAAPQQLAAALKELRNISQP